MTDNEIRLKEYLDDKFLSLEKLIDSKLEPMYKGAETREATLKEHDKRISSLERWRTYIAGSIAVVIFIISLYCSIR